jgi:hypothetical protein
MIIGMSCDKLTKIIQWLIIIGAVFIILISATLLLQAWGILA